MTNTDAPAEWALKRANEMLDAADIRLVGEGHGRVATWIAQTFARYIEQHEEPPVDPLLAEAEALALGHVVWETRDDKDAAITLALTALRRGIEIGRDARVNKGPAADAMAGLLETFLNWTADDIHRHPEEAEMLLQRRTIIREHQQAYRGEQS